jgi:ribonuclease G
MVRLYTDKTFPLSALYSLTTRLEEALSTKVWLKSGGFLVIEETEALTVIDVNSGKNIAGKEKEKTFQTVNLEAALECARQIRLRNFNGIIIIDFINCKDNAPFIHALKAAIAKDPIKTSYIDITPLGLVEVTRQKKTPPLSEKIQKTHQS